MELKRIDYEFSVCKTENYSDIDLSQEFCFLSKTDDELSLVCKTQAVPENITMREDGWKAFRIQGILDFSLIGIIAEISTILAENKIGIFVISTYNTDYVLVKENNYEKALRMLEENGYIIV